MTCQCGVSFCYVCGVPAEADSGHWLRRPGGCPRFGVAGSEQVMFDDDFADIDGDDDNGAEEMVVWEQGDGELTTFDFNRWAWQAAMAEGTAYASQLDLMFGTRGDEAQFIDDVRRAMEMYNPVSHSGVSEEQWHMLAGQHGNAIERWLADLHFFVSSGAGTAAEHLGGTLLDFTPRHIFNVVVRADLEAGALWLREANESTLAWVQTQEPDVEFPGSVVFDVGPGGIPGQSWNIRDAGMFRDLPGLGLFKLAGGALLVVPKPQQVMEFEFDVGLLPQPTLRDHEQVQPEGQLPQEEDPRLGTNSENDNYFVLVKAGERQFFRRNEVPSEEWKKSHPILWALFCPVPFIIDTVFVGRVNQQGYDQEYGLEFRADLNIPGWWPTEGGLEDSIYSDILAPGLYSQNVRLMRSVSLFACWFLVYSCFLDWRTAARNR